MKQTLSFDDVLLVPQSSGIKSRSEVNLARQIPGRKATSTLTNNYLNRSRSAHSLACHAMNMNMNMLLTYLLTSLLTY